MLAFGTPEGWLGAETAGSPVEGGGLRVTVQVKAGLRGPSVLNFKLEFHLPFEGVVGVVVGHMFCQDLAHDDHFCVPGDIEELRGHQRVAVVRLKRKRGEGRGSGACAECQCSGGRGSSYVLSV